MCLPVTRQTLEAAPLNGVLLPPKLLPGAALPFKVQVMVVTGPPLELQTRTNTGGLTLTAVCSLNWIGPLMVSTPTHEHKSNNYLHSPSHVLSVFNNVCIMFFTSELHATRDNILKTITGAAYHLATHHGY